MKDGQFAVYRGVEYSAGYEGNGLVLLRSTDPKTLKNGFRKYIKQNGDVIYVKRVKESKLTEYYTIRTKAIYMGYELEVVDEKDDTVSIVAMGGDYRVWLGLGMVCIDRGVYQKWVNRDEVEIKTVKEAL